MLGVYLALLILAARAPDAAPPVTLSFREFFERSSPDLAPSARLLSLVGRRVRLIGYMAQMEEPPKGSFYLCPSPVLATEAGGGTADLPPDAVLVVVRSAKGREVGHIERPLEVTGLLELGPQVDEDGRVSRVRIVLDGPGSAARTASGAGRSALRTHR